MRALVFTKTPKLQDVPQPERLPGQALIEVSLAGICNTDIEITQGASSYRGILGHEFVGSVVEADDLSFVGRRVVGAVDIPCGKCEFCRAGMPKHCSDRQSLGMDRWPGCLADYVVLPEANLVVVPDSLSDRQAVFAELASSALEIVEQTEIPPGSHLIVLGDGKLGLLTAQVLKALGHTVTVLGKHIEKLAIARRHGINCGFVEEFNGFSDLTIDCTGNPEGLAKAVDITRPRGTVVIKSAYHGTARLNLTAIVAKELTCIGSRLGSMQSAIELLNSNSIDTECLIEEVFSGDEVLAAFKRASRRDAMKVLVDFS